MSSIVRFLLWILIIAVIAAGLIAWFGPRISQANAGARENTRVRDEQTTAWINNPAAHPDWALQNGSRCGQAPFQMPTSGFIGYLWDDSFRPGHRHQGIDIFGSGQPGDTPVYAAFDGYLTRRPDWKSSVIIRLPRDPLQPDRQIWTYYTHMAEPDGSSLISPDFPPGTAEVFVRAGTLLGHQGNFSGTPGNPVGVHLHFSIVLDDGKGGFRNELDINNTLDPSPYFGMNLNGQKNNGDIPRCPTSTDGGES